MLGFNGDSEKSMDTPQKQQPARLLTKKFSRFFHIDFNGCPQKSMKNSPLGGRKQRN
jgi:hypothetical protein